MAKVWRYGRWVIATLGIAFVALVIYRIPAVLYQKKTAQVVAQIHAQRLTMADVDGNHLPPPPDPKAADATVEGIDANANGIRDDVELAIFAKYPNDIKIRAAALQYAKALQMEMMLVINSESLVAATQEADRAGLCIVETAKRHNITTAATITDVVDTETKNLVFNNVVRKNKREEVYRSHMTSYGDLQGQNCDVAFE